jgi:CheY-like chemotaxis protein
MPTVLVVEDTDDIRQAVHLFLAGEGYSVVEASGGFRALDLLRAMPDHAVVLFDYAMPEGDGLYLLGTVAHEQALQRRHAYICMSARPSAMLPDTFNALRDRLQVPLIVKPFDLSELLNLVEEAHQRLMATVEVQLDGFGDPPQM